MVTAFGILFDFQGFDKKGEGKISVKDPKDMVEEEWVRFPLTNIQSLTHLVIVQTSHK
jgi:hypothetical protein